MNYSGLYSPLCFYSELNLLKYTNLLKLCKLIYLNIAAANQAMNTGILMTFFYLQLLNAHYCAALLCNRCCLKGFCWNPLFIRTYLSFCIGHVNSAPEKKADVLYPWIKN